MVEATIRFDQLKNKLKKPFMDTMRKEIIAFTKTLNVREGEEVAKLVIVATHQRHTLMRAKGFDVGTPLKTISSNSNVITSLRKLVKSLQENNNPAAASGIMVWLHTLRCAIYPELHNEGEKMWKELKRGFIHVESIKKDVNKLVGQKLCIDEYNRIPVGFSSSIENKSFHGL